MTAWGLILILVYLGLGLRLTPERKAYRLSLGLSAMVLLAVSVGML